MSKKLLKNLDNIWYHYKPHILIGLFLIITVAYLFYSGSDQKESALNVALLGTTKGQEQRQVLQEKATSTILGNESEKEIKLMFSPVNGSIFSPENKMQSQKLLVQLGANEIDVMILEKQDFYRFAQEDLYLRLDNLSDFSKINDYKTVGKEANTNENNGSIYGIEISGNPLLTDAGFDTENKVLGIVAKTQNKERAIEFVKWLLNS